ncbi:MAG: Holliday junction helicase RuvA [Microvirga sp.]|jgi:putative holliday junction resolvase|nr:Holliday junction helicase RuvA [Microvirga sp.]MCD6071564.1 Holliday junction helicase RuvA [Microvirga sp.]MDF2687366.1 Holliday junction helicase RuvA [Microvirga sp.]MDF2971443.1 Holliday junction helicase RuvA [Microvirga sp.]
MISRDDELVAFIDGLPARARLMGLDLGTKTIGLALSDVERRIATPLETIKRVKFTPDVGRIKDLADRYDVGGLVFGLPLNMDGTEGPRSQATRAFVRNLKPLLPLPILFWDERMSTMVVTRTLLDADASRAKRADAVDKMAAAYILQGALDRYERIAADAADAEDEAAARAGLDMETPPEGGALDET